MRDLAPLSRRALLAVTALAAKPLSAKVGDIQAKAVYRGTKSGLLFFDKPIFMGMTGFDELPCRGECLDRSWGLDPDNVEVMPAPVLRENGSAVKIEYRVRRGSFTGEIAALSDGIGNGGAVTFNIGDGTVNAAVDELARSLPANMVRRAIVPAKFDLDAGTRPEYPRVEPPGVTYLEISMRKPSATGSVGVCPGGDGRYNQIASCICGRGPASVELLDGFKL